MPVDITLVARYGRQGTRQGGGVIQRTVTAQHPVAYYERHRWFPQRGSERSHVREKGAQEALATAERIIRFMDLTGLKPSKARVFDDDTITLGLGFDHSQVWQRERRYLVTTEPYETAQQPVGWLVAHGWTWLCVPELGMWNPPATVLYICSPPKGGVDLSMFKSFNAS